MKSNDNDGEVGDCIVYGVGSLSGGMNCCVVWQDTINTRYSWPSHENMYLLYYTLGKLMYSIHYIWKM